LGKLKTMDFLIECLDAVLERYRHDAKRRENGKNTTIAKLTERKRSRLFKSGSNIANKDI
jgi:hypothetical protein